MKVIFKKLEDIEDTKQYPIITREMESLFDGKTIRYINTPFSKNHEIFTFNDGENYFLIHESWIK